jgi:hypothetical protein
LGQFPDGDQDGIKPAVQTVQSDLIAQLDAGFEINSHPRQQRDFRIEDGGGQFAFRHVPQSPAGFALPVHDRDGVAAPGEIVCRRQTGRPGPDDDHRLSAGGGALGHGESGRLGILLVLSQEPFHFADGGRFIENAPAAALFARMVAKAAQHSRQRQGLAEGSDRFVQLARLNLPNHGGNVQLQRAEPMAWGETIPHVVAEKQFQRGAARLVDFLRFAFDDHAGGGLCGAGGDQAALTVGHDLDQADLAGGQRPALFQVAKGRNVQADLARGLQDRPARRNFHRLSINGDFKSAHVTSMAFSGQILRQVSQRVQSSRLIWCLA